MRYTFDELKYKDEILIKECLVLNGWSFKAGYKVKVLDNITDDYLSLGVLDNNNNTIVTSLIAKDQVLEVEHLSNVEQTVNIL